MNPPAPARVSQNSGQPPFRSRENNKAAGMIRRPLVAYAPLHRGAALGSHHYPARLQRERLASLLVPQPNRASFITRACQRHPHYGLLQPLAPLWANCQPPRRHNFANSSPRRRKLTTGSPKSNSTATDSSSPSNAATCAYSPAKASIGPPASPVSPEPSPA